MTELQYAMLERWAAGDFEADFEGPPAPVPLDEMAVAHQPAALDLAALEGTAGTPFYPGIESWKIMRNPELYAAPLRMQRGVRPGDLTIGNALPWQADYLDCNDTWWPVQRPTHVTRDGRPLQRWAPPGWGGRSDHADYNAMVHHWWRLGFVVSHDGGASFVEVEREIEDGPG